MYWQMPKIAVYNKWKPTTRNYCTRDLLHQFWDEKTSCMGTRMPWYLGRACTLALCYDCLPISLLRHSSCRVSVDFFSFCVTFSAEREHTFMQIKDTRGNDATSDRSFDRFGSPWLLRDKFYFISFIDLFGVGIKKNHLYSTVASCEIEGEPPGVIFELLRIERNISRNMHTFILLESYLLSHDSSLSQQSTFSCFWYLLSTSFIAIFQPWSFNIIIPINSFSTHGQASPDQRT